MNKKMVVIYGNCHTEKISEMLNSCPEFCNKYDIHTIKAICNIESKEYFELPCFSECDVFVHQSIKPKNRYGEEFASENVIKKLKPNCHVIAIPNVYHLPMCFFPQYTEKTELKWKGRTVFFRDSIVDNAFDKRSSVKQIVTEYNRSDMFDHDQIRESFEKFIEKVKSREKDWDIKVSDFILENYREHKLFNDPNHPTNYFLKYISNAVLLLLDVNARISDEAKFKNMDGFEMPICQSVVESLKLSKANLWGNDLELRHDSDRTKPNTKPMKLAQYIQYYCAMKWSDRDINPARKMVCFAKWFLLKATGKVFMQIARFFIWTT